jgi:hypothetical protein
LMHMLFSVLLLFLGAYLFFIYLFIHVIQKRLDEYGF